MNSTATETRIDKIVTTKSNKKKVFIETYGCQMNFADSEVVLSILKNNQYEKSENAIESDLILINTCSIREKAEINIRKKLSAYKKLKKNRHNLLKLLHQTLNIVADISKLAT